MIDRQGILQLVPHGVQMCLLDQVVEWDRDHVRCLSGSHREPANPLSVAGMLSAINLIEYAAQATAVHCGLIDPGPDRTAGRPVLAAVRDVQLRVNRIDDITELLEIAAYRQVNNDRGSIYSFEITAGTLSLASGRITVLMTVPT